MADPDLELRGGPGCDLLTLLSFVPSVISSFFTRNKGERASPPGLSPRSATAKDNSQNGLFETNV